MTGPLHITLVIVSERASFLVRLHEAELVARKQALLVPLRPKRLVGRQQAARSSPPGDAMANNTSRRTGRQQMLIGVLTGGKS